MKRIAATIGLITLAVLGAAPVALAAGPTPFSLVTVDVPRASHQPVTGSFTANGVPGCASGTFADALVFFTPSGSPLVVTETYSCSEGSTFVARLQLHLAPVAPDGTQAVRGSWRIVDSDTGLTG